MTRGCSGLENPAAFQQATPPPRRAAGSTSYRADPKETTEWDDLQRKYGNLPKLEKEVEPEEEEVDDSVEARFAGASAAAMAEAVEGDDMEEDEEATLAAIRAKRMEQLMASAKKNKVRLTGPVLARTLLRTLFNPSLAQFGALYPLTRDEYTKEVTEGSKECWVVVLLYNDAVDASRALQEVLERLAPKHKAVKFLRIKADQCIEGFPDRNVPTLLLYHEGENQRQLMGPGVYGGKRNGAGITEDTVEWVLADEGVLSTDLTEDPRPEQGSGSKGAGGVFFTGATGMGGMGYDEDA